jgi:ATP-dependent RNA helicase RhlE
VLPGPIPQHPVATTVSLKFDQLGLGEEVLDCLDEAGFVHPTPIQAKVIPEAMVGRDLVGLAETGSGKTAAFVLPLLQRLALGEQRRNPRAVILSPTREIALQTKAFFDLFGRHVHLHSVAIIGGVAFKPQIDRLRKGVDVVVATPGRLLDHMQRGNVRLGEVEELVLDEADHMLDLGFLPQISDVLKALPKKRHTMMFSATMPDPIERLAQRFMNDPLLVDVSREGLAAEGISHRLYLVDPDGKRPCVLALLNSELGSTLVFTRRKSDAEWLCRILEREGHPVEAIHGDRSQQKRLQALEGFREGQHRILVATDIAARGLDVPGIDHIINFDLPDSVEDYVHRAGRTARGAALGIVSSIGTWADKPLIKDIERTLGEELPRCVAAGVEPFVERQSLTQRRKRSPLRR